MGKILCIIKASIKSQRDHSGDITSQLQQKFHFALQAAREEYLNGGKGGHYTQVEATPQLAERAAGRVCSISASKSGRPARCKRTRAMAAPRSPCCEARPVTSAASPTGTSKHRGCQFCFVAICALLACAMNSTIKLLKQSRFKKPPLKAQFMGSTCHMFRNFSR